MNERTEWALQRLKKNDYSKFKDAEEQRLYDIDQLEKEAKLSHVIKAAFKEGRTTLTDEEKQFIMDLYHDELQERYAYAESWSDSQDGSAEFAMYRFYKWLETDLLLTKEDIKDMIE